MPMPKSKRLLQALLVIGMGASALAANAEIFRCKSDSGQTVISDRPCGAASAGQIPSARVGAAVDLLAAPDMANIRARDASGDYAFVPARGTQVSSREPSQRQVQK